MWLSVVRAPAPRPGLLTRTERAEVERLRYRGRRRDEWIAGRLAARRVLARRLGAGVRDVSVVADPAGAPRVTGGPAPLAISLSHDGGRVAVARGAGTGARRGRRLRPRARGAASPPSWPGSASPTRTPTPARSGPRSNARSSCAAWA